MQPTPQTAAPVEPIPVGEVRYLTDAEVDGQYLVERFAMREACAAIEAARRAPGLPA